MVHRSILVTALAALVALGLVGVVGYMAIAEMGFMDALYMTVITLSTVGYVEVQPLTTAGRLFTILLLLGGLGIVFYSVGVIARDIIEGEIQHTLEKRKVERQIEQLIGHYVVCGYGRMGRNVCRELADKPVPFIVVEREPEALKHLKEVGLLHLDGDATEDAVLLQAGIKRARGLVSALSSDSDNVYVVLTARELNPELLIVARAEDDRSERKLLNAGATRVVSPYVIGGFRMAHALLQPAVLEVVDLVTQYRTIELQIEEISVARDGLADGRTLEESGIRRVLGIIVVAIKKQSGEMLFNPAGDVRIEAGDRLVLMGQTNSLQDLEHRLGAA